MSTNHYINVKVNASDEHGGNVYAIAFVEDHGNHTNNFIGKKNDIENSSYLFELSDVIPNNENAYTSIEGNLSVAYANVDETVSEIIHGGKYYYVYIVVKDVFNNANVFFAVNDRVNIDTTILSDEIVNVNAKQNPSVVKNEEFILDIDSSLNEIQANLLVNPFFSWVNSYTVGLRTYYGNNVSTTDANNISSIIQNNDKINNNLIYENSESFATSVKSFFQNTETPSESLVYGEYYSMYNVIEDKAFNSNNVHFLGNVRAGDEPTITNTTMSVLIIP